MKKNIWKRLATLTIVAALVLCLLPVGVSAEGLSGSTFESPGDELVFAVIFTCACGEEERLQTDGQDKDVDGHSITIKSFNYNFGVGTYSFDAEVTVTGCSNLEHTETFNVTDNSFTCHGMYLGHYHDKSFAYNSNNARVIIGIKKKTDSHSFDKTAADGVCKMCGHVCSHDGKSTTSDNCAVCNASLVASVRTPDKILYFTDADDALEYAEDNRGIVTKVTILKNATVNRGTVATNIVVNSDATLTFSGLPDSETFAHVKGSVSGGGTISGQGVTLEVDEGCAGCTFELPVENYGTVTGGIFNRGLKNYGTVKGGTILGTLKNAKGNLNGVDKIGTVYADNIKLGTNFRYEAEEGTTLICSHTHGTAATCVAKQTCPFDCTDVKPIDPNAHAWSEWTYSDGKHSRTCAHGNHPESDYCTRGEDGKCTVCKTDLVASLTSGDTTTYYKTVDEAFAAAQTAGSGTVTVLANAAYARTGRIIYSNNISLVVNSNVILTLNESLYMEGRISGGGTIADFENRNNALITYAGSTIEGITATARLNIAGGTIFSGTFTGRVQNDGTIKGGTFSGMVYNNDTIEGGTFSETVVNHDYYYKNWTGTISGGTFNCTVENSPGTINGGTFNGQLINEPYSVDGGNVEAIVNADSLTLGENFRFTNKGGTVNCATHKHTKFNTPATCVKGMICIFCGEVGVPDPAAHSPIYAATGSEINETCANGCTHNAKAALSGSVANLTYTGKEIKPFSVSYTGDPWQGSELEIVYEKNINAGFASAAIEVDGKRASYPFEILKATPKAEHFVFTPPTELTYDGTAKTAKIDPVSTITGMGEITVTYYRNGVKLENESPAAAGTYTVSIKVGEGINFKAPYENRSIASEDWTFTVKKAECIDVAPVAKKDLAYNGAYQELITAGSAKGGQQILYKLSVTGAWETAVPTAKDVMANTVYWKVEESDNYTGASGELSVEIAPVVITVTPDAQTITYGDAAPALTYTSSGHIGTEIPVFEGELAVDNWEGGTREIKQGTLKIVDGSSFNASNYELKFVPGTLTVEQAVNSWIAEPNVTDWDYGMTPNIPTADPRFGALIREFRLESGTDADYKTEIPTVPGTYLVRFRVEETGSWTGLSQVEKLNIGRAALRVQVKDQTIKLGQQIDKTAYTVVGLAAGDTATVTLTASTDKVTVDGRIEAKVAVRNAKGEDVTDYYTLALMASKLTIKPDTSGIDALTAENVTSADKQAINAVLEALKNAESTDKAWDDIADKCENLLTEIEAAQAAANSQNVGKVENVNSGNVKPENKADLEKAKAELEKALQDHGDNFTEAEKQVIKDKIQRMNGAVESLEKAADITEAVAQLPKTVEPDDEATAEKILAAKAAYDGLTDHEKSLVDQTTKGKLDELVTALTAYDIIKGDGSQWIEGVDGSLSFTANGPFSKFVGIEVDGKAVDAKYYDAKSGSTIIALKESYLKQLSAGKHTITVHYSDGKTSGVFTIQLDPTVPPTGDESNIMLYGAVFAVSLAGLAALVLAAKNRRKKNA